MRGIADPAAIAREHLLVREEVMREAHGLRALKMRVAGHQRVDMPARLA